jgi:antitoxin component of MazEF toxin-antitoxin module
MTKTLTKHGNSYALVIDKPIMELLGIDPEKPVEVSTDGTSLIVTAKKNATRTARLERAMETANRKFTGTFRNLAK